MHFVLHNIQILDSAFNNSLENSLTILVEVYKYYLPQLHVKEKEIEIFNEEKDLVKMWW